MPTTGPSLLARLRTSRRVRAVCRADDDGAAEAALGRLPRLEGDLPPPHPGGIIFASCDDGYLHRYGLHLARSALHRSPEQACHLHLVDPTPGSLALLARVAAGSGRLSFSFERLATAAGPIRTNIPRYIICSRFVRAWQLLAATASPIIMLDADSLVRLPLTATLAEARPADVALFLRVTSRAPWRQVLGAALIAMPTDLGRRFMRDCAVALADAVGRGPHLATDQLVLYRVWRWYVRGRPGFRFATLSRRHSDWRYGEASPVWHAKGARKRSPGTAFDRLSAAAGAPAGEPVGPRPPEPREAPFPAVGR